MSTKYQQLAETLREQIPKLAKNGNQKLATEWELATIYNVSRQTVRRALSLLEEEGLIARRQGSGSYLAPNPKRNVSRQIAVMTTFLDDYIFPSILRDAQNLFSQAGYTTLIFAPPGTGWTAGTAPWRPAFATACCKTAITWISI